MLLLLLTLVLGSNCFGNLRAAKSLRDDLLNLQREKEAKGVKYPTEEYFVQELDHFNVQEQRTWKQRFYVNDEHYKLGGPVFFQVGGEGTISAGYVVDFMMSEYARQEGALQVALEHRFYGKSHPFPTLATENLAFLSSVQALADASTFLTYIRKTRYPGAGSTVTFGGSYPGNLASWFRLKYPHMTVGSIASSAPVLAILDMITYLDVVDESLKKIGGKACADNIHLATQKIQAMLKTSAGRNQVKQLFNTCSVPETEKDIATFMSNLMDNWMGVVQYNREGSSGPNITGLCAIMTNAQSDPLQSYIKVSNLFLGSKCMDVLYQSQVSQLTNLTDFGPSVGMRQWTYQTCTEFGYFQSTDSADQPFGDLVPLSYFTDLCKDVFGFDWLPRTDETNIHYGARDPQSTNVVFVNGNIDPWHSLSVLNSTDSGTIRAILIDGTAHCADMIPARARDPPGLASAQKEIGKIIHSWMPK